MNQPAASPRGQLSLLHDALTLTVTVDVPGGIMRFEWALAGGASAALGQLSPSGGGSPFAVLQWSCEFHGVTHEDGCGATSPSTRALMKRIRDRVPTGDSAPRFGVLVDVETGAARAGQWQPIEPHPGVDPWKWLEQQIRQFARMADRPFGATDDLAARTRNVLHLLACWWLRVVPAAPGEVVGMAPDARLLNLRVSFDQLAGTAEFLWRDPQTGATVATGMVAGAGADRLLWKLDRDGGAPELDKSDMRREAIRGVLGAWLRRFKTNPTTFAARFRRPSSGAAAAESPWEPEPAFGRDEPVYPWIEDNLVGMAEVLQIRFGGMDPLLHARLFDRLAGAERHERRLARKEQKRAEELAHRQARIAQAAAERRRREPAPPAPKPAAASAARLPAAPSARRPHAPTPPVPVTTRLASLEFQDTNFPLTDLRDYALRERAALWWVSNQSDDLLCLPHCRIQRLEYQVRSALRVLGPLRGRALLSDEVGLGKTIEAGLVLKELLTRGLVKRFLVLTLPSLVDQWEEELADKFGLVSVTTNHAGAREDPEDFWRRPPGIIASLHTLKQPAQLAVARDVHWDLLIVDEAHYLRNRESQAWQAVNVLPRQFLLLLTATPVQNSLEELYNLVTLLKPGQLPTPREFRARFFDPAKPRQPRDPAALRRLLGEVMIRNTRASSGLALPPRRAETVLFEPDADEGAFWKNWEGELRAALARLGASQASLWGRLLLQAAGSSPAAWRAALTKFPDAAAAQAWREQAPLDASWRRKCRLLAPLARTDGGVVVFTQFLETQAALAAALREAGVEAFVINGATPAPERQPITEKFRRRGGALLLTHSGTEGRNLQFCHCLANFDLPWNPMEIEQRIGRLHRLGQQQPVHIHNFVQVGTLQEHLLELLQEKLNLFELVVGETGLVLGERYSGDEFEEELLRRWRESDAGRVGEAIAGLGDEMAAARARYGEVKELDATLFAQDFEAL